MPEGREIQYVAFDNPFMQEAKQFAEKNSACSWWPTGAVVVKDGQIIGRGSNSGKYEPVCPRYKNQCPTGTGYELCKDVCQQTGHSEVASINDALIKGYNTNGADLYLFGHWWCCQPCWDHMIEFGINNVYLLENAHNIFTPETRKKVMKQTEEKIKKGEVVIPEDTKWNI